MAEITEAGSTAARSASASSRSTGDATEAPAASGAGLVEAPGRSDATQDGPVNAATGTVPNVGSRLGTDWEPRDGFSGGDADGRHVGVDHGNAGEADGQGNGRDSVDRRDLRDESDGGDARGGRDGGDAMDLSNAPDHEDTAVADARIDEDHAATGAVDVERHSVDDHAVAGIAAAPASSPAGDDARALDAADPDEGDDAVGDDYDVEDSADDEGDADEEAGADGEAASGAGVSKNEELLVREGDLAGDYLERLLDLLDYDGDIDLDVEAGRAIVSIDGGDDLQKLVGQNGSVLEALQELTRLAVQQETGVRSRLMLDVAQWRAGRRTELARIGHDAAQRVLSTGNSVKLAPMTPFERKIVHDAVARVNGVYSESEGEEPRRRVVVFRT